jgi:sugar phosphate isomerase/epimerase
MPRDRPQLSVFPKCYFDELCRGEMVYLDWIRAAATLGAEGLEHYDGFFHSSRPGEIDAVIAVMRETGQDSAMLCFSPDFTHPDPDERARQIERQKAAIDLAVRLGARFCRTLSGQRHPGMTRREGIDRTIEGLQRSLEHAERRRVVLCLENHYKDGNWQYPEFAQPEDVFLEILNRVDSPWLGVQYDPSNALVGGYDPIAFLGKVIRRVVTMHASDRYLAEGASLEALRLVDGTLGYPDQLRHGETGKGSVDYDAVFRLLSAAGFTGWISVEDGLSGLDELRRCVEFLESKRAQHYPAIAAERPSAPANHPGSHTRG